RAFRIIERANKLGRTLDEHQSLTLVPGVVAEGDHIDACIDQFLIDYFGNAEAPGGIFPVEHHEIELPIPDQYRQTLEHGVAPAAADDVSNEQNPHLSFRENR